MNFEHSAGFSMVSASYVGSSRSRPKASGSLPETFSRSQSAQGCTGLIPSGRGKKFEKIDFETKNHDFSWILMIFHDFVRF